MPAHAQMAGAYGPRPGYNGPQSYQGSTSTNPMIDHDKNVGTVRASLKELGIEDNTIVMYSTDNGPHMNSWPDAAMTPFRRGGNMTDTRDRRSSPTPAGPDSARVDDHKPISNFPGYQVDNTQPGGQFAQSDLRKDLIKDRKDLQYDGLLAFF
jgi:hypothetical protein